MKQDVVEEPDDDPLAGPSKKKTSKKKKPVESDIESSTISKAKTPSKAEIS